MSVLSEEGREAREGRESRGGSEIYVFVFALRVWVLSFFDSCMGQYPSSSTLQENIKALSVKSWESVQQAILGYAESQGVEKGRTARMDSYGSGDEHSSTDRFHLVVGWDRVITQGLAEGKNLLPVPEYSFVDHNRIAKKRVMRILNARKETIRQEACRNLFDLAGRVRGYAFGAIPVLYGFISDDAQMGLEAGGRWFKSITACQS